MIHLKHPNSLILLIKLTKMGTRNLNKDISWISVENNGQDGHQNKIIYTSKVLILLKLI